MPTTTAGMTYGKKLTMRKKFAPRTPRISPRVLPPTVTRIASANASTITTVGSATIRMRLLVSALRNVGSWNSRA